MGIGTATIIAGALNAGMGVGSSFLSNMFADNARAQNYMLNEKAAENADRRARAMYEDYMSPLALLQQYRQAGLSPSLMFGGGGIGGATPQGAQGEGASGLGTQVFGMSAPDLAQMQLVKAQTRKLNAEADTEEGKNDRGEAEINKLVQQVNNEWLTGETMSLDNMIKQIELAVKGETAQTDIDIKKETLNNLQAEGNNLRATLRKLMADGKIAEESANSIISYYRNRVIEQYADIALKKSQKALADANVTLTNTQVQKLLNDIAVDNENINISKRRVDIDQAKLDAQIEQWAKQNGFTERRQIIAITALWMNFINSNDHEFLRALEEFSPLQ